MESPNNTKKRPVLKKKIKRHNFNETSKTEDSDKDDEVMSL